MSKLTVKPRLNLPLVLELSILPNLAKGIKSVLSRLQFRRFLSLLFIFFTHAENSKSSVIFTFDTCAIRKVIFSFMNMTFELVALFDTSSRIKRTEAERAVVPSIIKQSFGGGCGTNGVRYFR